MQIIAPSYPPVTVSDGNTPVKFRLLTITSWDMDTNEGCNVAHGIADITKIRGVFVTLRNDAGTVFSRLDATTRGVSTTPEGNGFYFDTTDVIMGRQYDGTYDNANYASAVVVRGWIYIIYEV